MPQTDAERAKAYRDRKRDADRDAERDDRDGFVTDDSSTAVTGLKDLAVTEMERILRDPNAADHLKVAAAGRVKDLVDRAGDGTVTQDVLRWREVRATLETLPVEERLRYLHAASNVPESTTPMPESIRELT
jgi:hypothetical protein